MPDRYILFCYSSVVQRRSTKTKRLFDFFLRRSILPNCRKNFTKRRFDCSELGKSLSSLFIVLLREGWIAYRRAMNCRVSSSLVDQSVTKRTGVRTSPRLPQSSKLTCCFNSSILSFGR